jgi:8-oxo-dGTP pyrophosphatase MutT (NUDIX family)
VNEARPWIAPAVATARIAERLARVLARPSRAYEPWIVAGHLVGWIIPERAARLSAWREVFRRTPRGIELSEALDTESARSSALADVAHALSAEGALTAWRNERYAVAPYAGGAALCELERSAARYFGIHTFAAHASGVVGDDQRWRMWLARRSPVKPIDPGLLDNLVGGGIAAGTDARSTLIREAFEEAGIPADLAHSARSAEAIDLCRDQTDGLQRETIHVFDLWLPDAFVPSNQDGEAVEHRLCAPDEVLSILEDDGITADASLAIVDFLRRHGHVAATDPAAAALDALRHPPASALEPALPFRSSA